MQRQRRGARLDETRADLEARAGAVLEAATHLHRDGHVDRVGDGGDDAAGAVRVVEQGRAGARLRHLLDRAAEVDVDDVGARVGDHPRRLGHQLRFRAEDLDGERVLVGCDAQVAECALIAVVEAGAADHLGADEPGAEPAALAAKRLHADARHRREHEARWHLDVANPPRRTQIWAQNQGKS